MLTALATSLVTVVCIGHAAHARPASGPEPTPHEPTPHEPTPHDYAPLLEGPWSEVRRRPIWDDLGLDPDALAWSGAEDAASNHVRAAVRYDDVDRDGAAEAYLALFDGHTAHFFVAPALGPSRWGGPLPLAASRYQLWDGHDQPGTLPARFWPASDHAGGRTLIGVRTLHHVPAWGDVADALFEYETAGGAAGVRQVLAHEGASEGEFFDQVFAIPVGEGATGGRRDLLLFSIFPRAAWTLPVGGLAAEPAPWPEGEHTLLPGRDGAETAPPPQGLHALNPLRVAHALRGAPAAVAGHEIWRAMGVDPDGVDLRLGGDAAPGNIWRVHATPVYEDFDRDGLPDAYVVLRQGNSAWWLVLAQDEPGVWSCAGVVGEYSAEHARLWGRLPHTPWTPDAHHVNGRTLLVATTGHAWGLGAARVEQAVLLLEGGRLHPLWSELVRGYEHGEPIEPQAVSVSAGQGAVLLAVRTWDDATAQHEGRPPRRTRTWTLAPGRTTLQGPTTRERF